MSDPSPSTILQNLFGPTLDTEDLDDIVSAFEAVDPNIQQPVLNIGLILSDYSMKAAAAYFRVLPEVLQFITADEVGRWVGMGIKISQESAASGIRYFKEAPRVFSLMPSRKIRDRFIEQGLLIADENFNLALEYYRQAPILLSNVSLTDEAFSTWVMTGRALGREDYTFSIEYFRVTPNLLPHLSMDLMPLWIDIGRHLASEKLMTTLVFMRNSPDVFSALIDESEKTQLLDLTYEVSVQNPLLAVQLFTDSVSIFPPLRALNLQKILLEKALDIATFDADIAYTLFLSAPKVLKEMGDIADQFPAWVDEGMLLLKKGSSGVDGFFSLKGRSGREAITRLRGGVSLSSISKTLKIFAEALSGIAVSIKSTSKLDQSDTEGESGMSSSQNVLDTPTTDGESIFLPPHICYFSDNKMNFEWYKVATAYQAGYLEYRSFYPQMNETADLIESLQNKYKKQGGFKSLTSFFSLFPEPNLIEQFFQISEGARVEAALRREYPGLRGPMNRMRAFDLDHRPSLVGLSPRAVVLELLLQISLTGKTKEEIPKQIQKIVFDLCQTLGAVHESHATVATSMKAAASAFDYLYEGEEHPEDMTGPMEAFDEEGIRTKGQGEESGELRASTRGMIDPKRVEQTEAIKKKYTDSLIEKLKAAGLDLSSEAVATALSKSVESGEVKLQRFKEGDPKDEIEQVAEKIRAALGDPSLSDQKRTFYYDEWDCVEDDYRPRWCRVVESQAPEGEDESVQSILSEYHGMIHSITSAFQMLRPEGFKRIKGDSEGDALDLDALISARVEIKAGMNPSDRIYISHQKKERSVAVAFLVDMSGSTQQHLPHQDKSILQIEKEALILMSRAVDAIGDSFAIYGFSGKGKDTVDFSVLKDFDAVYNRSIDRRIAQMTPAIQNRDGAAIRHAVSKLSAQPCKTKILVLMSDGKPLDDDYRGSYATADTKMALREAKNRGVHPYCITVDREGAEYLKGMYGDVSYMVIDHIESLPARLPKIYKSLTV